MLGASVIVGRSREDEEPVRIRLLFVRNILVVLENLCFGACLPQDPQSKIRRQELHDMSQVTWPRPKEGSPWRHPGAGPHRDPLAPNLQISTDTYATVNSDTISTTNFLEFLTKLYEKEVTPIRVYELGSQKCRHPNGQTGPRRRERCRVTSFGGSSCPR